MKRFLSIIALILTMTILSGCDIFNNDIYNKSYNVEIDIVDFENAVVAAIEKADTAVIGVSNYETVALGSSKITSVGSGVVYKSTAIMKDGSTKPYDETMDSNEVAIYEYYAITNRHVIEDAAFVRVYFGDIDIEVDAEIMALDPQVDLAVIRFEYEGFIQPLAFADSDSLKKGSFAIALGSPSGHDYYGSATFGIISHPKRYLPEDLDGDGINDWEAEYIQHDVAINPGNSGGPLINIQGEIIGINTMKFVSENIDNMGFSIPSNLVSEVVKILETGREPSRPRLGVTIIEVWGLNAESRVKNGIPDDIYDGLFVTEVSPNGIAAKANVLPGDTIISFNGEDIRYTREVRAQLNSIIEGSGIEVEIIVIRDGEEIELSAIFWVLIWKDLFLYY